jgi:hypothetical protein
MAPTRFTSEALITRNNFDALDGGFPRPRPSMSPQGGVLVWVNDVELHWLCFLNLQSIFL